MEARLAAAAETTADGACSPVPCSLIGRTVAASVDGRVAAARRYVGGRLPALALADGAAMDDFEIVRRLGARARPAAGNNFYGVNSAVFECVHVPTRAVVAVKLLFTLVGMEVETGALHHRHAPAVARVGFAFVAFQCL